MGMFDCVVPCIHTAITSTASASQWSNLVFFCAMHVAGLVGAYFKPLWYCHTNTALLCFLSWQLAIFGITIGYHRLYSHRSFRARRPLRLVLALLGTLGFQGSVKCTRVSSLVIVQLYLIVLLQGGVLGTDSTYVFATPHHRDQRTHQGCISPAQVHRRPCP